MCKSIVFASMLLLFAGLAVAQVPTSGNVFVGYSYYSTNLSSLDRVNTNGWQGSLEGEVAPFLGIVADFDGHYGSQNFLVPGDPPCPSSGCPVFSGNFSEYNVLFGPRFSVSVGKFRPFAEFEFGVGHVDANAAGSDTSFAMAFGGGLDYRLIRVIAWRLQGDYVSTRFFGTAQNNLRLSSGIVLRF
jgi:hypothetical protein